jgi:hypothetical protein
MMAGFFDLMILTYHNKTAGRSTYTLTVKVVTTENVKRINSSNESEKPPTETN